MNRQQFEERLHADAGRIQADCPERVGQRVAARIRNHQSCPSPSPWFLRPPALAGAAGALVICAVLWVAGQPGGPDRAGLDEAGLNVVPVVTSSDRLMASREAALANERRLLEQDLRNLRDQVTATFDTKPNG
ncbi:MULTISPECIES: hypothetical protein [unclassified Wenzhouxiangella]|uniref:hypothetical protein n=1 Tax=unclassified Wenzhouxiangella TaxID=2613841 RepID=UPI000E3287A6|nr:MULTISPECIES: hypothetical protein [unclassified Wenzhouxiangella]RFF28807.1 hypothetical protein DZK25_00600 [Wenzhouxiangella sp. 15181]RFP68216.1 hypothetical protein DZK26_09470 [Wenzhouxiangella sp. 15190]